MAGERRDPWATASVKTIRVQDACLLICKLTIIRRALVQVDDLDGTLLYQVLGLRPSASSKDIKAAYRQLARQHHPDKQGDPEVFGRIQHAYEVLGDAKRRAVYDSWAKELQFRYVRATQQGQVSCAGRMQSIPLQIQ
jgi:DnaJ-class molecular chaperone